MEPLDLEKASSLFNLISQQPDIGSIYLHVKDPYEGKYQFLINKGESTILKQLNDSEAFIEYSIDIDDIFRNIEEYDLNKRHKIFIVFDDIIAYMLHNKKLHPIVT